MQYFKIRYDLFDGEGGCHHRQIFIEMGELMEEVTANLPQKAWFRAYEVAEYLCVSVRTVQQWCASGKLSARRLPNGVYLVPRDAIVKLLTQE